MFANFLDFVARREKACADARRIAERREVELAWRWHRALRTTKARRCTAWWHRREFMAMKPRRSKFCRRSCGYRKRQGGVEEPLAGDLWQHRRDACVLPLSRRRSQPPVQRPLSRAGGESRIAARGGTGERDARVLRGGRPTHAKWHIDMHTAIRPSVFEQFALLPYTGEPLSRAMFDWLQDAGLSAVLLHQEKSNTFTHFTAEQSGALACTLELGKVRPFGHNDLTRFAASDAALRRLIAGLAPISAVQRCVEGIHRSRSNRQAERAVRAARSRRCREFHAVRTRHGARRGWRLRYEVLRDEERIVFPNPTVKPGLRAGLMVIDTTQRNVRIAIRCTACRRRRRPRYTSFPQPARALPAPHRYECAPARAARAAPS